MRKFLTFVATAIACAAIAYAFLNTQDHPHVHAEEEHEHSDIVHIDQDQMQRHGIGLSEATSGHLKYIVKAPARIAIISDQIAHIYPKVSGITLKATKNLGEEVQQGDVLVVIESKEVADTKAGYLANLKRLQLALDILAVESNLREKGLNSLQEHNSAQKASEEITIALELSKQKLFALGLDNNAINELQAASNESLREYSLTSPINGRVISRHITAGELVAEDHEVYVIANLDNVWAEINVFSQDRPHVQQGQKVSITTGDGQRTEATVVYLSPIVDETTHTSQAIAVIDNASSKWFPGTYANAEIISEKVPVDVMVSRDAVQNVDGEDMVFVLAEEGFKACPVKLGRADNEFYEIIDGVAQGQSYACKNTFLLKAELKKDEAEHMD